MTVKEFLEEREMHNPDIEDVVSEYAKLKCQELLLLVADKAKVIGEVEQNSDFNYVTPDDIIIVDKDSILNAVELDSFTI